MSYLRGMKIGCHMVVGLVVAVVLLAALEKAANANVIVLGPTAGSQTLFSYNANSPAYDTTGDGPDGPGSAKINAGPGGLLNVNSNAGWVTDYGTPINAWMQPASTGNAILEWHFQAAPGDTIASDASVPWDADFFGAGTTGNAIQAYWASDAANWTTFVAGTSTGAPVCVFGGPSPLAAHGWTGGTDLYVRFLISGTNDGNSELFRATAGSGAGFALTGSVVPEPSTIILLGTGLFGLLAYAWRKRR